MDNHGNVGYLDTKMLYELHDIETWQINVALPRESLQKFMKICYEKANMKFNKDHSDTFIMCNPSPSISFNGNYVIIYDSSSIKVLESRSEFSVLHEIEIELNYDSQMQWSLNNDCFGVCIDKTEIIVYNVEGNEICRSKKFDLDRMISTFHIWTDSGYHFLTLSDDRLLLTHTIHDNINECMFEFSDKVLDLVCLTKSSKIITTHITTLGQFYY